MVIQYSLLLMHGRTLNLTQVLIAWGYYGITIASRKMLSGHL